MRIEPTEKSIGVGSASSAPSNNAAPSPSRAGGDHVDLSALSQAAAGLSPQRMEAVQNSIHSGTYEVSGRELSRRIVDFYLIPAE